MIVTDDDLDIAARTLWGECRGEPEEGQIAVAWVIRTRAEWNPPQWWGHTVKEVCLKPKQFSCWNLDDPNHDQLLSDQDFGPFRDICRRVFDGEIPDPTGGATHYERVGVGASWAKNREFNCIIGRHAFYTIGPGV